MEEFPRYRTVGVGWDSVVLDCMDGFRLGPGRDGI